MFLHLEWWKWVIGIAEMLAVYVPMHVWSNNLVLARASERQRHAEAVEATADQGRITLEDLRKQLADMDRQNKHVTNKLKALQRYQDPERSLNRRLPRTHLRWG